MSELTVSKKKVTFRSENEARLWAEIVTAMSPRVLEVWRGRLPTVHTSAGYADEVIEEMRLRLPEGQR